MSRATEGAGGIFFAGFFYMISPLREVAGIGIIGGVMNATVQSPPALFRRVITPSEQCDNIAIPKEWFGMKVEVIVWGVPQTATGDPISALHEFHKTSGLSVEVVDEYLRQVREDRKNWRRGSE